MPLLRRVSCLFVCLLAVASIRANADTFSTIQLGTDSTTPVGITSTGAVVIYSLNACPNDPGGSFCYTIGGFGGDGSKWSTLPVLAYDNGSPCSAALPSGYFAQSEICNGSRFAAVVGHGQVASEVVEGLIASSTTASDLSVLGADVTTLLLLNSMGDVAFVSPPFDFEAINLTSRAAVTPEPSALVLAGTGLLAAAHRVRRKLT